MTLRTESSLCQGGALVGIGARRAGPRWGRRRRMVSVVLGSGVTVPKSRVR